MLICFEYKYVVDGVKYYGWNYKVGNVFLGDVDWIFGLDKFIF